MSDRDGTTLASRPAAGLGTAVIAVRDAPGKPRASISIEVRAVGRPLPAALAIEIARRTDGRGEYVWTELPPGEYEFVPRDPEGERVAARRAVVPADETVRVTITLG